jgi:hypothetical protein
MAHTLRIAVLATLAVACTDEGLADLEDSPTESDLRSLQTLGVYLVDGTTLDESDNAIVYRISQRIRKESVGSARYFAGPEVLCDSDARAQSCKSVTERVVDAICKDFEAGRIKRYAVFGYSRGAFVANKAAVLAKRCVRGVSQEYAFGGFIDGVQFANYLKASEVVPSSVAWVHLHRDTLVHPIFPVTLFSGSRGENEAVGNFSHKQMGESDAVAKKLMREANKSLGKVFEL